MAMVGTRAQEELEGDMDPDISSELAYHQPSRPSSHVALREPLPQQRPHADHDRQQQQHPRSMLRVDARSSNGEVQRPRYSPTSSPDSDAHDPNTTSAANVNNPEDNGDASPSEAGNPSSSTLLDHKQRQLSSQGRPHPDKTGVRRARSAERESLHSHQQGYVDRTDGRLSSRIPSTALHQSSSAHTSSRPSSQLPSLSTGNRSTAAGGPSTSSRSRNVQSCAKCNQQMTGSFVRALGSVFHLDCFRCQDCNKVVASKFFPVDGPEGRQHPLCETDYFRRLSLICAQCGAALRGSYITALDMKFHVEHFTCSVCPTVFGPQDSYYEHDGKVYCHFHYSTRFAVKCTGCKTAILKQFVEINRNNVDEHWHPECYMIHKFWNIKLVPSSKKSAESTPTAITGSSGGSDGAGGLPTTINKDFAAHEKAETAQSLRDKQKHVEAQVYRIWTVLSTFEESSAACISEMLRHVSNGHYLDGVRMAERFVLHVETLFAAIDDLNASFRHVGGKEIPHVREARMLCKKVVNFFSLLSHTHESGAPKMGITQELLSLVTGLAHYLKILIRIALTAALKLERDHSSKNALSHFLSRLDRLCKDGEALRSPTDTGEAVIYQPIIEKGKARPHGYKSLPRPGGSVIGQGEALTDLCEGCRHTVEEECIRFGTSLRWHLACLSCSVCHRHASKERQPARKEDQTQQALYLKEFRMEEIPQQQQQQADNGKPRPRRAGKIFCSECLSGSIQEGYEYVTRLEQYAFLLCVALSKLYLLLKQRGVVPSTLPTTHTHPMTSINNAEERSMHEAYRDSSDIKRMKSVNLDRKVSTTARVAQRLTVVESPSARYAQPNESRVEDSIRLVQSNPQASSLALTSIGDAPFRPTPQMHGKQSDTGNEAIEAPHRPSYNRSTTAIRVVEDATPIDHGVFRDAEGLGSEQSPVQDEQGITLADLHQVMEAEQAREQQRFLPRQGQTQLLSELSALEYFIVKHAAALTLASDIFPFREFAELDELLDIIDAKKNNFWGKLFKGDKKKEVKKKGVFGVPLDILVDRHGADSMLGAGPGSLRIPMFIDDVVTAMKQMDLSVEGIFRKNGNIRRLKDLAEIIDRDAESVNLLDDNPVQIAALLKKFLRDLPDPLLTFRLQHLWLATQRIENDQDRHRVLHLVCCLMPKTHRDTMEVLFVFLKWVASFSHVDEVTGSKMDLKNLATVICPNILYSKGKDASKDESFLGIQAIAELLQFQDEFFTVPHEVSAILQDQDLFLNPNELSSKEILKKAELYLRESQRFRERGSPENQQQGYRNGHRGEVKQTHPHFHTPFPPPPFGQYRQPQPSPTHERPHERPVSWQPQHHPYRGMLSPGQPSSPHQPHPQHQQHPHHENQHSNFAHHSNQQYFPPPLQPQHPGAKGLQPHHPQPPHPNQHRGPSSHLHHQSRTTTLP